MAMKQFPVDMGVLAAALLIFGVSFSYAAPAIPHVVYGNATISGQPAPAGTIVAAIDSSGKTIAEYTVSEPGKYGFLAIPGDDSSTPQDEGAVDSETISFSINSISTGKSIRWRSGKLEEVSLSSGSAQPGGTNGGIQEGCRELFIASESDEYAVPDEGMLFGYVIAENCIPAAKEQVEISVSLNSRSMLEKTITTDDEGTFELSFSIDSSYSPGTYTAAVKHGADSKSESFRVVSVQQPAQPAQETQPPSPQPSQTPPAPQPNATANTTATTNQTAVAKIVEKEEADEEIGGEGGEEAQPTQAGNMAAQQPQPNKSAEGKGAAVTISIPRAIGLPEIRLSFLEQFYLAAAALILVLVAASYLKVR